MDIPIEKRLIGRAEVEELLGVSRPTVFRMVRDGRLPRPIKIGPKSNRWRGKDILAIVENMQRAY